CTLHEYELAWPRSNRNHRVNRHDTGLHRLTDAAALDHPGGNLLQRIKGFRFDFALAIERFREGVDHTTEQPLPDGDGEQATSRFCLIAFRYLGGVIEENSAHLGLLMFRG